MKSPASIILGILVMILAAVGVWEFTVISDLKKEVKAKELMIDAQAVRMRDVQEQLREKDETIRLLTTPPAKTPPVQVAQPARPTPQPVQPAPAQTLPMQ